MENEEKLLNSSKRDSKTRNIELGDQSKNENIINTFHLRRFSEINDKFSHDGHEKNTPEMNKSLVLLELQKDSKLFRTTKLLYLFIPYFCLILISLIKGSEQHKSILNIKK